MPYSAEIVRRARQRLESMKADKESVYQQHLHTAYEKVPQLREIDMLLRKSMAVAAQTVFTKGGDAVQAMNEVKEANLALQQQRQALIDANFEKGFLDDSPVCPHCGGAGYMGSAMCRCLGDLCRQEQLSELARLTNGTERFEAFRLDYYPDRVDSRFGASPRSIMDRNLTQAKKYAADFSGEENMLLIGGTGLGKTFLSACVANAVADKGFSVAYESAPALFSKLEKNRFNPDDQSRAQCAQLTQCDLLIIDDLGTELPGNFVTAALYNLLNDRLLNKKSMLISSNLNIGEIGVRYSPQIASRLQGCFKTLPFVGEDIRVLKNRGH